MPAGKQKRTKYNNHSADNNFFRMEGSNLLFMKELKTEQCDDLINFIRQMMDDPELDLVKFDLSGLEDIDSAGVITIFFAKQMLADKNIKVEIVGGSPQICKKIELFRPGQKEIKSTVPKKKIFELVGEKTHQLFSSYIYDFLILGSSVSYYAIRDLFNRKSRRKGEFLTQSVLIGVNAVWIIVLMSYIIGLVIALHSAAQLRDFGADIFIVDIIVIGTMRQMGPLIAAILVAGRSSSAIAAEIATMKVTTELDALKTMGLDPVRFVVIPKIYACMFTMPFLIILANTFGIAGGATAAYSYLNLPPEIFTNRMSEIVQNKDLFTGLVKSQVYAWIIVLTGAFYGFRVERGAEDVGRATTVAVVVAISLVILADSILGLLFY